MGKAIRWLRGLLGMKKEKERTENPIPSDTKVKKRWSFAKTGTGVENQNQNPASVPQSGESSWLRSYEEQQSKHAIAVAAATEAAADAAVAAAQAAVAVVRLTSKGRGMMVAGGGRERLAAVKIQNVFRGYLARKALRALKGLVKLQAVVRGYLVRRRAAATLHSIQALIRAQASVRSQRAHRRINKDSRSQPERNYDEFHSKRLSSASSSHENAHRHPDEKSSKIVEVDNFRPRSGSRRIRTAPNEEEMYYCYYYPTVSSPHRNMQESEWGMNGDEGCRRGVSSTAQSTPRFANSYRSNAPPTPAKSVCGDSFYRQYSNFPNYMMNTESFCAKLRSHSAPRQRPATTGGASSKKRMSLNEIMASRNSFSGGVRMNKSCAEFNQDFNF